MKIAYLTNPFFADCDIPLIQQLQQIVDVYYIVTVKDQTKDVNLIHVKQVKDRGGIYPQAAFPELEYLSRYIDLNKTYILNMPGEHGWSPENVRATYKTLCFLRREKFDVIHLTWPLLYESFMLYALRKKMIVTIHDPLPHSDDTTQTDTLYRKICFKLVDNFILLNQTQKEEFVKTYGLYHKNIFFSHLSTYINLRDIAPKTIDQAGYVLFIGSISSHKGVEYLCEAMRHVHQTMADARLIVAGKGEIYFDSKPYVAGGYVELRNYYIEDRELVGLIKNAAFIVCPYIDATQSGVIMSAFALNKPVIATNVGALPEMVTHKRHGLIVEAKDAHALADAITDLLAHPETVEQMSENIRHDYSKGSNSWKEIAQGMANIYKKITDNKR